MTLGFIEDQRAHGRSVVSICTVLREQGVQVAERTYRSWKRARPSTRDHQDAVIIDAIRTARVDADGSASSNARPCTELMLLRCPSPKKIRIFVTGWNGHHPFVWIKTSVEVLKKADRSATSRTGR